MAGKKKIPLQRTKKSYAAELAERQKKFQRGVEIAEDWTAQLCLDTIAIVLNDSDVMGRDVFGAKRLQKVAEAFNERFAVNREALSKTDDAEYRRVKIDQALARIYGPEYVHWHERYPYWDENDTY